MSIAIFFWFLLLEVNSRPIPVIPKHFQGLVENPINFVSPENRAILVQNADLTYRGGIVLLNIQITIILWGNGTYIPELTNTTMPQWYQDILGSPFFGFLSEYYQTIGGQTTNVGVGSYVGRIMITPSPANGGFVLSDTQIQSELQSQINQGFLPYNSQTVYMIYFPTGTTILNLGSSCMSFCGYHSSFTYVSNGATITVKYGVVPDLTPFVCQIGCGDGGTFQQTCQVSSHELAEITTDPRIMEPGQASWYDSRNGEVADICLGQVGTITVSDRTWHVQKLWSQSEGDCIISKDFSINYNIVSGGASITLTQLGGSSQLVQFSVDLSSIPSGVQPTLNPTSLNNGTISLTVTGTTNGPFTLTIDAEGEIYQKTLNIPLTIS